MRRRVPLLDSAVVTASANNLQSYQINSNKSLQLRAFLIKESGVFSSDGRQRLGKITMEDIDMSSKRQIGRGTSGVLYWAKLTDGTAVALKEIPITSKSHRDEVDRELSFFSSQGNCPFVMSTLGAFWDAQESAIVIVMDWMAYNLKDFCAFWEGMEESILRDIVFQIVSGLRYLHDTKRVIHRDIKPLNILLSTEGYIKIADFGISKLVETIGVSSTYVGTMYFMAPERLEDTAYGFNSDVWSVGLTIIAIATGRNPWAPPDEINMFQLLNRIAGGSTPTLPQSASYSPELHDFVAQCLERDPEKRVSSAALLKHPFLKDCTEAAAVQNVKTAVDCMTLMIENNAKQQAAVLRNESNVQEELNAKIDRIGDA